MKARTIMTIMISAMMLYGMSTRGFSQETPGCKNHGMKEGKCEMIPNLTDEQKGKIEKLKTTHMKETMQLKNQIKEKKAHERTLMTADKPDMTEINKTIDEIGALQTEMMKKEAAHIQSVRALLTEEQRVAFDMHTGKGGGKMHGGDRNCCPGGHTKNMGKCTHGTE